MRCTFLVKLIDIIILHVCLCVCVLVCAGVCQFIDIAVVAVVAGLIRLPVCAGFAYVGTRRARREQCAHLFNDSIRQSPLFIEHIRIEFEAHVVLLEN